MKNNKFIRAIASIGIACVLVFIGYRFGSSNNQASMAMQDGTSSDASMMSKTNRKVLYWHDPMVPGNKSDKPGKSPFMDMQLVPVYADEGADGGVKVSPTLQQNLGIRFATVRRVESRDAFEMVGNTQFDESATEVVQSRTNGYIDKLYARSPMQHIKRGEPIASVYVPEWIAPQEEYLVLKHGGNTELAAAARQRMRAMSIPDGLIAQMDRSGQSQKHITLTSPVTGVITELSVRDGAMVTPGMTIAKIAGLSKVWLVAEVPEALANTVRPGMSVEAISSGDANKKYTGKVREVLPGINASTRTLQARLELDNRDGNLTPGMLMRIRLNADKTISRLLVPTEAVITTGKQSVVLVAGDNNSMRPVVVTTGRDIGDDTEIVTGLTEGQKVVASGQFLIDSEASLKSVLPKFTSDAGHPQTPTTIFKSIGKVEKATPDALTLSHQPIAALGWGAMTMDFKKAQPDAFKDISVGQEVEFRFKQIGDDYVLDTVKQTGAKT
jgi:Cu(I)/Ag(I) efflux system membrane fusion protein